MREQGIEHLFSFLYSVFPVLTVRSVINIFYLHTFRRNIDTITSVIFLLHQCFKEATILDDKRDFYKGTKGKDFVSYERDEYKKRTGFTDSAYYKVVTFSMKLYRQAVATGKDIEGNDLSPEEVQTAEMLVQKMTNEIKLAEEKYIEDHRED